MTADLEPGRKANTATPAVLFGADQLVAGRFRIVRLLAKGGMGEGPLSLFDPRWDALRADARFLELKKRVGL